MAKGRLYICTGRNEVIAIDAESGRSLWRYDARPDATGVPVATCRGVAYYKVPAAAGLCAARIITATIDASLLALARSEERRVGTEWVRTGKSAWVANPL